MFSQEWKYRVGKIGIKMQVSGDLRGSESRLENVLEECKLIVVMYELKLHFSI